MPSALFVVSIYNYHREVEPIVHHFADKGWDVTILLGWVGDNADKAAASYSEKGCRVIVMPLKQCYIEANHGIKPVPIDHPPGPLKRPKSLSPNSILRALSLTYPRLSGLWHEMHRMRAAMNFSKNILRTIQPDVIFQGPFHSVGKVDNSLFVEAGRRGVFRCCYPVSTYHGRKGAVSARFNNLAMGMLPSTLRSDFNRLNKWLAKFFPEWTQSRDGTTIFMWDPVTMLAAKLCGLLEKDIWQKPSPRFDSVFVFNQFSKDLLESDGFPMEKVIIVGIPLLDNSISRINDKDASRLLYVGLGLNQNDPFILFNVEPSLEHHYCASERHWENFRTMMSIVTKQGLPVILSLHPLCKIDDYNFAETEFGVRISRQWKIYDLYPHCSFAVSFPCSTNLLADMFGKPLAIYDFFNMAHPDSPRVEDFRLPKALVGHDQADIEENVKTLADMTRSDQINETNLNASPEHAYLMASDNVLHHVEQMLKTKDHGTQHA